MIILISCLCLMKKNGLCERERGRGVWRGNKVVGENLLEKFSFHKP